MFGEYEVNVRHGSLRKAKRSRTRREATVLHTNQPRHPPRPPDSKIRPRHPAPVRQINVFRIESVGDHPVAERDGKAEDPRAADLQHYHHWTPLNQLRSQLVFTFDFVQKNSVRPANALDAPAAGA